MLQVRSELTKYAEFVFRMRSEPFQISSGPSIHVQEEVHVRSVYDHVRSVRLNEFVFFVFYLRSVWKKFFLWLSGEDFSKCVQFSASNYVLFGRPGYALNKHFLCSGCHLCFGINIFYVLDLCSRSQK